MSADEQHLADLLKRVVPEPPRQLTYEEITVRTAERTVKSWLMPTLAAASVLVIGGAVGAVAATRSNQPAPGAPAAYQNTSRAGSASPSAAPTSPGCQPSAEPTSAARGGSVAVPSVVGQAVARATQVLQQAGLIVTTRVTPSPHVPAGMVVLQSPAAGANVPAGATVTLTVSPGSANPSALPTPTCSGIPVQSASPTADPASAVPTGGSGSAVPTGGTGSGVPTGGSGSGVPTGGSGSGVPTGGSGSGVPTGGTASAVPTAAAATAVPNFAGRNLEVAEQEAQAAGFAVRAQAKAAPAAQSVPNDEVWSQTPAGGTVMPAGTTITLFFQP